MADATAARTRYAAAWAVILGSLLISIPGAAGVIIEGANYGVLFGLWVAYLALQFVVFAVLVAIESQSQRAYWSASIPVSIVIAQVVAGLSEVLVGDTAHSAEVTYADVLF